MSWRRLAALLLFMVSLQSVGCVHANQFVRGHHVRHAATDESINAYIARDSSLTAEHRKALRKGSIVIGMPMSAVEMLANGNLAKTAHREWRLTNQFVTFTPGLYPYFDSRQVYLYWEKDTLAAIIIRGSYNVYP